MSTPRCPECGSWDRQCSAETPVPGCGCARCLSEARSSLLATNSDLRKERDRLQDQVADLVRLNNRRYLKQLDAELDDDVTKKDAQCYHHLVGLLRANRNALAGEVLDWFVGATTHRV